MKCGAGGSTSGIKIAGRNNNHLRYADDTALMAESEEELKKLLMRVKEESEKPGLKLSIQKTKIMASSAITFMAKRWGKSGNSGRFYFLGLSNHCGATKLKVACPLKEKLCQILIVI